MGCDNRGVIRVWWWGDDGVMTENKGGWCGGKASKEGAKPSSKARVGGPENNVGGVTAPYEP